VLAKELEQLGLPKGACAPHASVLRAGKQAERRGSRRAEHADAVCKPYSKDRERLRSACLASSLQLARAARCVRWRTRTR
jgi:hypothetical protein